MIVPPAAFARCHRLPSSPRIRFVSARLLFSPCRPPPFASGVVQPCQAPTPFCRQALLPAAQLASVGWRCCLLPCSPLPSPRSVLVCSPWAAALGLLPWPAASSLLPCPLFHWPASMIDHLGSLFAARQRGCCRSLPIGCQGRPSLAHLSPSPFRPTGPLPLSAPCPGVVVRVWLQALDGIML